VVGDQEIFLFGGREFAMGVGLRGLSFLNVARSLGMSGFALDGIRRLLLLVAIV
jgi:hypothetical protein